MTNAAVHVNKYEIDRPDEDFVLQILHELKSAKMQMHLTTEKTSKRL